MENEMHISNKRSYNKCPKTLLRCFRRDMSTRLSCLKIAIFMCDLADNRCGVKKDNLGYTMVDLNNLGPKVDLFVLALQEE